MKTEDGRVFIGPRKGNVLNTLDINPKGFHQKLLDHINSLTIRLNLLTRVERLATEIAIEISNSSQFIGFRPRNLATAILFVLINYNSVERKKTIFLE